MGEIVDLFAGPGGWSEALRLLGRSADEIGIEYEPNACKTRAAAGHRTLQADVSTIDERQYLGLEGLIASPPCQAFSAGKGAARDLIPELLDSIRGRRWTDRADPDPRVWLIVDLGRWLENLSPEWIALEQVPAVLPIWRAYAELLRERGYSTWTGILNSADYGVPQTRMRAILIATRGRTVQPPPPTHAENPVPSLFGELAPWQTMEEALPHISEHFARWRIGFPRLDDRGDSPDGYRERDWRNQDEPAQTVTEKARSWKVNTGQDFRIPGDRESAQQRYSDEPAPTIAGQSPSSWKLSAGSAENATNREHHEPAPTLAFGHDANSWTASAENGSATIKITVADALVLQSFRADYPVQGGKSKQFEQIGNAIPPRLAWHVLRTVLERSRDDQEEAGGIEFPA